MSHEYLYYNKRQDWLGSLWLGVLPQGDGLRLLDATQRGVIFLRPVDSDQPGFTWSRAVLDCHCPPGTLVRVFALASDAIDPVADVHYARLLGCAPEDRERIAAALGAWFQDARPQGLDACLDGLVGRYLYLKIELVSAGVALPCLNALRVKLSGDHMLDYLPAIYEEDFTRRFLSIFDGFFSDMEQEICALPGRMDYQTTDDAMLRYLSGFLCLSSEETGALDTDTLRERIRTALADYETQYTPRGVLRSAQRLCGKLPILIEYKDVNPNRVDCKNPPAYRRLYGQNPYKLFLLLEEDAFSGRRQREAFLDKMNRLLPAHLELELVLLKKCVQLDWHTYLGVNSYVGSYVPVAIDENTAIHYDSMIAG